MNTPTPTPPPTHWLKAFGRPLILAIGLMSSIAAEAQPAFPPVPQASQALAVLDLASSADATRLKASWRTHDAKVVNTRFFAAAADGQPGTQSTPSTDLSPRAGAADFDDRQWPVIAPESLSQRRGHGLLAFNWYRTRLTVPERVGDQATQGMTLVFQTTADDYAEIWVDGELPRAQGQNGGSVVAGWNAGNRLVVARNVKPGQQIQLAVFAANGPLSAPPTNYIYLKEAKLEFHAADVALPMALPPHEVNVSVLRKDPAMDRIVSRNPKVFKLAEGFQFTEGPVWVLDNGGALLFSDPNANRIYRLTSAGELSVFREGSGYAGADVANYHQPGSNGLTLSPDGLLTFDQHGNRQVVQLQADGTLKVLADRDPSQGAPKRLNSPNDLVYRSDGTLYFTDPPFGLPKGFKDPGKELAYSGVYRVKDGEVTLVARDFTGPNGLAFSPDEKYLYIGNWDDGKKVVNRYPVLADGMLGPGTLFHNLTPAPGEDAIDGVKVDRQGNVYVSGPGGLWVLSPEGKHLGTIITPRHVHNFTFGDEDGKTLYLCAREAIYKMRLNVEGIRPQPPSLRLPAADH
jgi:Gluconolactonase